MYNLSILERFEDAGRFEDLYSKAILVLFAESNDPALEILLNMCDAVKQISELSSSTSFLYNGAFSGFPHREISGPALHEAVMFAKAEDSEKSGQWPLALLQMVSRMVKDGDEVHMCRNADCRNSAF